MTEARRPVQPDILIATAADAPALDLEAAPARPRVLPLRRLASLRTFDSLRLPAFRWFFLSLIGSMAALNTQMIVRSYVAYQLTGSYAALGLVALASAIPMVSLSLIGGVIADRAARRFIMLTGQTIGAALAVVLGLLLLFDRLEFEHLLIASAINGTVVALSMPARQAMTFEVVGRGLLMNAVSLTSAGMNLTRLWAPAGAGLVIAAAGAEYAYFGMAGLYLLSSLALFPVPAGRAPAAVAPAASTDGPAAPPPARGGARSLADLRAGARYARRDRIIFILLLANLLTALLAMPHLHLLAGFVDDVFDRGAGTLGLLMAISGAGALLGALVIASLPERRRGVLLLLSAFLMGLGLLLFAAADALWLAILFMLLVGVGSAGRQAFGQVLVQAYVDDAYRGRVMSIYMAEFGLVSFGTFGIGLFAEVVGARGAFAAMAVGLMAVCLVLFALAPRLRRLQ